jgi:hypothetical protein
MNIQRENKVVLHNDSATCVILNGSLGMVSCSTPDSDHSLRFSNIHSFGIFLDQCTEILLAAEKELKK